MNHVARNVSSKKIWRFMSVCLGLPTIVTLVDLLHTAANLINLNVISTKMFLGSNMPKISTVPHFCAIRYYFNKLVTVSLEYNCYVYAVIKLLNVVYH